MSNSPPDSTTNKLITPPFVIAVLLLGASAGLAGPFANWMRFKQAKLAIDLRAPLSALGADDLAPYRVIERKVLTPEVVDALGTDRYISWLLEDTSLPPSDPLHLASLFVTYYSGGRDLVPHTPDVCYLGSGYEPAQMHENIEIEVPSLRRRVASVPVRVCTFAQTAVFDRRKRTVLYTFHCNGRFTALRNGVRVSINNPRNTYAYFSKVEISFPNATRAESIKGAAKLLGSALPPLIENHWPDFDAAEARVRNGRGEP